MRGPQLWSASSLKAPRNGSVRRAHRRPHPGLSGEARRRRPFSRGHRAARLCRDASTTKQKLADELVAGGYVILLVDSYATRGIDQGCTLSAFATFFRRRPDAYGALVFLGRQSFVDPHRVAAVGFSSGAWVTLSVARPIGSNCSSLQATCGSGRRLHSIRHARAPWRVRDTHAHLRRGPRRLDAGGGLLR